MKLVISYKAFRAFSLFFIVDVDERNLQKSAKVVEIEKILLCQNVCSVMSIFRFNKHRGVKVSVIGMWKCSSVTRGVIFEGPKNLTVRLILRPVYLQATGNYNHTYCATLPFLIVKSHNHRP